MKKLLPCGYGIARGGSWTALFLMGWDAFLMSRFLGLEGARDGCIIMTVIACLLAFLFVLSDVTTNLKRRSRIKHMNDMLRLPYVYGSIVKITPLHSRTLREIDDKQLRALRGKHKLYTFTACYTDPRTGEERTVTSEPYVQDLNVFLSDKAVKVHYSDDGEVWAEPCAFRETLSQESVGGDKKGNDRRFWVWEHAVPLAIGAYAFAGIVIFLVFRHYG